MGDTGSVIPAAPGLGLRPSWLMLHFFEFQMQMHFPGRVGGRLEGWADPQQLQLQVDVELYAIQKAVDAMQDTDY